ncbi:MAG: tetratricopeptide repeat protein [Pirellulaceae bacterium]
MPASASVPTESSATASLNQRPSYWILSPAADMTLIIGSPVIILLGFLTAKQVWSAAMIASFIMVWQVGHHLPGMMRAYGDPALFRRFRIRFLVAPILLMLTCAFAFLNQLDASIISIAMIWGWWHYLMQAYGFVRIYDSKVRCFSPVTRWLDWGMCLIWFAAAIILNDNTLYNFVNHFYTAGLPVPATETFNSLRSITWALLASITAAFLLNLVISYVRGSRPSPVKVALMIATFGSFWYSTATITNIVVAYAFFELFHDVQYLTIVWAFNRNRVKKDSTLKGFTKFVFQPRVIFVLLYVGLIAAYGSLKVGAQYVTQIQWHSLLMAFFLTSTLLHYYFDGFIWKLRESDTQTSLDIAANDSARTRWTLPKGLRHGLLWSLFVIPFCTLIVLQAIDRTEQKGDIVQDTQRRLPYLQRLAEGIPSSILARFNHGLALEALGNPEAAIKEYQAALDISADYEPAKKRLEQLQLFGSK